MINETDVIGQRLKAIRQAFSDATQSAWADKNGFNATQYNNWERGIRRIPVDEADIVVERYGLTLDFIFKGREDGLSSSAKSRMEGTGRE